MQNYRFYIDDNNYIDFVDYNSLLVFLKYYENEMYIIECTKDDYDGLDIGIATALEVERQNNNF